MSDPSHSTTTRTALVTGATSGLGFAAAAHLAKAGYDRVIITGRSAEGAESARVELAAQTGTDIYEALPLDLNSTASVEEASSTVAERGGSIDFLLLNAGMVGGSQLVKTDEEIEITYASSLIGHHQLTMRLLHADLLAPSARIVIAGSEAARGDVPTFTPVDLPVLAKTSFDGDMVAAASSLIRHDGSMKYKPANVYASAKLFVAWWAAALSRRLPDGMTVNAVSPGSAPGTDAGRNANFFMKRIMMPVMKAMPRSMGLAATVPVAAYRYIEAAAFGDDVSGQFFASAPKKMTGPLHRVALPHVLDDASQEAAWSATVGVSGIDVHAFV